MTPLQSLSIPSQISVLISDTLSMSPSQLSSRPLQVSALGTQASGSVSAVNPVSGVGMIGAIPRSLFRTVGPASPSRSMTLLTSSHPVVVRIVANATAKANEKMFLTKVLLCSNSCSMLHNKENLESVQVRAEIVTYLPARNTKLSVFFARK